PPSSYPYNCDGYGSLVDETPPPDGNSPAHNISALAPDFTPPNTLGCPGTFGIDDPHLQGFIGEDAAPGPAPGTTPATLIPGVWSPALNNGADAPDVDAFYRCLPIDERGVTRPQGAHCDIGAVEVRAGSTYADPSDVTVTEPGSAGFTAGFAPGEGGSPASA